MPDRNFSYTENNDDYTVSFLASAYLTDVEYVNGISMLIEFRSTNAQYVFHRLFTESITFNDTELPGGNFGPLVITEDVCMYEGVIWDMPKEVVYMINRFNKFVFDEAEMETH